MTWENVIPGLRSVDKVWCKQQHQKYESKNLAALLIKLKQNCVAWKCA